MDIKTGENCILGIETATKALSVAIVSKDNVIAEYNQNSGETHESHLMPLIEKVFSENNLKLHDLSAIAVSVGPGSFTGLRIGIATAKGLSFASGKSIFGIPTLDGLSYNVPYTSNTICSLIDAKRKELYAALYRYEGKEGDLELKRLSDYMVLSPEKLYEKIAGETVFVGEVMPYREELKKVLGADARFATDEQNMPSGASIAFLAQKKILKGEQETLQNIKPIYVRRAEAEEKLEQKEAFEIRLELMKDEDIPQVMLIEKGSFPTPWAPGMFKQDINKSYFLVARSGDKVIGYGGGWLLYDEFHLGNIAVHKDFRGRGIAKRILQKTLGFASSKGAKAITLEVRSANIPAQNLYQGFGFRTAGRRKKYYQDTEEDAIIMTLRL